MTVEALIEKLMQYPDDTEVELNDSDGVDQRECESVWMQDGKVVLGGLMDGL